MNQRRPFTVLQFSDLWNHYLPVLLAICAGMGFSALAFFAVRWWESRDIAATFQSLAEERASTVKGTFEIETSMLDVLRTSLMTDGRVEKDEFYELLKPFHAHDKSIETVEWIPRVLHGNRQEFEASAQHNGFAGFRITQTARAEQ